LSAKLRICSDDQPQRGSSNGSSDPLFVHVDGEFTPRLPVSRIGIMLNESMGSQPDPRRNFPFRLRSIEV
jgi:hypothetical protein